jgi:hypothetical protein
MIQGLSGGSEGLLTGRYSQYWNTGKGSTWEGGMHEAGAKNASFAPFYAENDRFATSGSGQT